MKKILLCILLCVSMFLAVSPSVWGNGLPTLTDSMAEISLDIPVTDLEVGDEVYIEVHASDVTDLYAFSMILTYDESEFSYVDINSAFDDDSSEQVIQQDDGQVIYAFTNIADGTQRDKKLATLTLEAKEKGEFEVSLDKLTLVYSDLTYAEYTTPNKATVTIGKEEKKKPQRPSGGGGGGISISGGGHTSTTAPVPSNTPIPAPTPEPTAKPGATFKDIDTVPWAEGAINALVEAGVLNGYDDGSFLPDAPVTRAEFAKMICLAFKLEPTDTEVPYLPDVEADAWYAETVKCCLQHGILTGDENGFRPNDSITREEMAVVVERAMRLNGKVLQPVRLNINFNDEDDISDFAVGAVDLLYMAEVLNGDASGDFRPNDSLSRAEAAKVVYEVTKEVKE